MSSTDMSMDTIMVEDESFASNTNAIIYDASYISGRTESLISGPNILNSSSTSEDDYHQQQISTAAGRGGNDTSDDLIISSCASSNLFTNNNRQGEVSIFNVDFRALLSKSHTQSQNQFAQAKDSSFRMWISDGYSNVPARNRRQNILNKSIVFLRKLRYVMRSEQMWLPIIYGYRASINYPTPTRPWIYQRSPRNQGLLLNQYWSLWMSKISTLFASKIICRTFEASIGDIDPLYRACIVQCEKTGCAGEICLPHCKYSLDGSLLNSQKEPLCLQLNQRDCPSDCKYHCMLQIEKKRASLGFRPVKYHGKWPSKRVLGLEEPLSVAFSALNLAKNIQGCLSFFNLNKRKSYDYASLWHIYGLLSVNSCVWSVVFHSRGMEITEKLNCLSAVALIGFSLIISILRSFNIKDEARRLLIGAPLFAFTITHILYLCNYQMDYGWNIKVCVTMGVAQLLLWAIWARICDHPSKSKIWTVVFGSGLAMFIENYDFPPYAGLIDAHALWHAIAIPLTCIWWSFIQDDAKYQAFDYSKKDK